MELKPSIQRYEWGKIGEESAVAQLYKGSDKNFKIDNSPYAELWMGTHPNGPAMLKSEDMLLSAYLEKHSDYLGEESIAIFGNYLPFLFKVLSVNKALSIQAHPSKKHAEKLHRNSPDLYKDGNHKPELAIALTEFKAMCGFRPIEEIQQFLQDVPELKELVGVEKADRLIECTESDRYTNLNTCFKAMMSCSQEQITTQLERLLRRLEQTDTAESESCQINDLIKTLSGQFPNDIGCFAPYFFNILSLQPGEAIFLGANEPHAYISGDCIECMACSDNVVRAGLTPKFKDIETLCSMLNYEGAPAHKKVFEPIVEDEFTTIYRPPVPDFAVAKITVSKSLATLTLIVRKSASILITIEGSAKLGEIELKRGTVIFIPANYIVEITDIQKQLSLYQSMVNIS